MNFVIFTVGAQNLAIPIYMVQEFSKAMSVSPVVGHSPQVAGLINLRGKIAVAVNLRLCLHSTASPEPERFSRSIILESQENLSEEAVELGVETYTEPLVLMVDRIVGVSKVHESDFHPVPANVDNPLIEALVKIDGEFLPLLSITKLTASLA